MGNNQRATADPDQMHDSENWIEKKWIRGETEWEVCSHAALTQRAQRRHSWRRDLNQYFGRASWALFIEAAFQERSLSRLDLARCSSTLWQTVNMVLYSYCCHSSGCPEVIWARRLVWPPGNNSLFKSRKEQEQWEESCWARSRGVFTSFIQRRKGRTPKIDPKKLSKIVCIDAVLSMRL